MPLWKWVVDANSLDPAMRGPDQRKKLGEGFAKYNLECVSHVDFCSVEPRAVLLHLGYHKTWLYGLIGWVEKVLDHGEWLKITEMNCGKWKSEKQNRPGRSPAQGRCVSQIWPTWQLVTPTWITKEFSKIFKTERHGITCLHGDLEMKEKAIHKDLYLAHLIT